MPELKVHITDTPDRLEELLSLVEPSVRVTTGADHTESKSCDILVSGVPDRELVEENPGLRALVIPWSGVPNREERAKKLETW